MTRRTPAVLAVLAVLVLPVAGCGADGAPERPGPRPAVDDGARAGGSAPADPPGRP